MKQVKLNKRIQIAKRLKNFFKISDFDRLCRLSLTDGVVGRVREKPPPQRVDFGIISRVFTDEQPRESSLKGREMSVRDLRQSCSTSSSTQRLVTIMTTAENFSHGPN
ncbi:hypothetical protein AVEN_72244-1 [Araneus ventricosus]|uniref:Uncharacterized protein n=1 Tax=Araneus ventricosus TaxID=182803 RepID=A0A4Y2GU58_ARAVE|nr:hypothetical protein AVEN_72244-1 [Araneus ventricosus]